MNIRIDRKFLLRTLQELVHINSVNPSLAPDAPGETEIAAYCAEMLQKLNLEVITHEPEPGRVSTVGILRGG
jgi:acetylornithine deacetylase/succinyl-diaminopimelate desuccinylase-like protein